MAPQSRATSLLSWMLVNEGMNILGAVVNKLQFLPLKNHVEGTMYIINNYYTKLDICYSQRERGWDGKDTS